MKNLFVIEQDTGSQFEPVPEGDFSTLEEARTAMAACENDLGWDNMRISMETLEEVNGRQTVIKSEVVAVQK